ncbi:MAG TPA: hypothetical protein VFU19_11565 [Iamia sp.]|nr:hypothetical protein [Iamia sp.]
MSDDDEFEFATVGGTCGHCRKGITMSQDALWKPDSEYDDPPSRPCAVYICTDCHLPSVVVFKDPPADGAAKQLQVATVSPTRPPHSLNVKLFADTTIEHYRDEAWGCYLASHYRSAIVTARSALQACCRRYLAEKDWTHFAREAEEMSRLAGTGWDKIGGEVRQFGNQWAHPDPSAGPVPTWRTAREALDRMDAVLQFIAALERFGHLTPVNPK